MSLLLLVYWFETKCANASWAYFVISPHKQLIIKKEMSMKWISSLGHQIQCSKTGNCSKWCSPFGTTRSPGSFMSWMYFLVTAWTGEWSLRDSLMHMVVKGRLDRSSLTIKARVNKTIPPLASIICSYVGLFSYHFISWTSRPSIRSITSFLHCSWWWLWCAKLYRLQQIALAVVSWPVREQVERFIL